MSKRVTEEGRRLANRLADALESGEYKKGKNVLRSGDKFCCLGVAYHLEHGYCPNELYPFPGEIPWLREPDGAFVYGNSGEFTLAFLNDTSLDWEPVIKILRDPPVALFSDEYLESV